MCGIAGIINYTESVDKDLLHGMCAIIAHRGPDNMGMLLENTPTVSVGLGAQRLSIIDLSSAGHMPMCNELGDVIVVYNGEIYNHEELRNEMERKGHIYHSRTDTETIIHAYEEYGTECLNRLNGMFAIAIYDRRNRKLILARDRMGIKPLYYRWDGTKLLFASELKALLLDQTIPRDIAPDALSCYLSLGYVPSPYCLCKGVSKLAPGSHLLLQDRTITVDTYWSPGSIRLRTNMGAERDLVSATRSVLEQAVHRQLMSDVPVGIFLSGGIDSTIITAVAQQLQSSPLDTFSIGFADVNGRVDEEADHNLDMLHARQVAKELGTNHHEVVFQESCNMNLLLDSLAYLDEPTWEPSFTSLNLMSRLARQNGVVVILTGDGGDELFGGYPWHIAARRLQSYEKIPALKHALPLLSRLGADRPLGAKARDLGRKLHQSDLVKYRLSHDIFSSQEKQSLLSPQILRELSVDPVDIVVSSALGEFDDPWQDKLALADLVLWVREHFNQRVDRMSMRNSVEARVPFQDNEVVDFALAVSMDKKIRGNQGKYLLRQAFRNVMPEIVLRRPKRPFSVPAWTWLRKPLRDLVSQHLSETAVREAGLLESRKVGQIGEEFMAGNDALISKVWALLNLQLWCHQYLNGKVSVIDP